MDLCAAGSGASAAAALDFQFLLKTVPAVLKTRGAF